MGVAWVSAAAHAPYSVSAALFRAIAAWNTARSGLQMVHLAESQAEIDFLARGSDFFESLLKRRGRWVPHFPAPRSSSPGLPRPPGISRVPNPHGPRDPVERGGLRPPGRNQDLAGAVPPGQPVHRRRDTAGAGVTAGRGESGPGHRLPGGQLGPESLWGDALAAPEFSRLARGSRLRQGTLNGARALGRDREFGSLESGKKAALGFIPLKGSGDFWRTLYQWGRGKVALVMMKGAVSCQLSAVSQDKAEKVRLRHDYFIRWAVPTLHVHVHFAVWFFAES